MRNSWNNQSMRLVWVVIPLVLIGIVGMYLVGSDFALLDPPPSIPAPERFNYAELCKENYLDMGYSSLLKCQMTEGLKKHG